MTETIAGARTAGQVDGSPIVAAPFFLGVEDPMAQNRTDRPAIRIGQWSPEDLAAGEPRAKTWTLEATTLRVGTNEVLFRYERGPHRLDIWRVLLLENGREVARDEHHGHTGTSHARTPINCTCRASRRVRAMSWWRELGTDPDFKLPPAGRVESFGQRAVARLEGAVRLPPAAQRPAPPRATR